MTTLETPVHPLPEPIVPQGSPLWPRHLVDIFVRPKRFFEKQLALGHAPFVVFVTWLWGLASAIDRVDQQMLKADLGTATLQNPVVDMIAAGWVPFWLYTLGVGAFTAAMLWYLGGWWYKVRVRWAGDPDADAHMARLVYVYSSFVLAAPSVLLVVAWTLLYPSYAAAWADESVWPALLVVFPFWSCWASYRGVTAVFDVSGFRPVLWFLLLPGVIYFAVIGGIAAMYAMAGTS